MRISRLDGIIHSIVTVKHGKNADKNPNPRLTEVRTKLIILHMIETTD